MSSDYDPLELQLETNKLVSESRGSPKAIAEIAIKTRWALEQDLADHKKEKQVLLKRAEVAESEVERLRNALMVILDQVDYTIGNCGLTEMVGAVLPKPLIGLARETLKTESNNG